MRRRIGGMTVMRSRRLLLPVLCVLGVLGGDVSAVRAQSPAQAKLLEEKLMTTKEFTCTFPLMATGTWTRGGVPQAETKTAPITVKFLEIDVEGATAQMTSNMGTYDVIVRPADTALHFIQSYRMGPLYTTSIFAKERVSGSGRFYAVHSRHEFAEVVLPGFTSRPEQYYGECQRDR